jgi:pimeloyl-ACP methyl ester carboxylesterase
MALIRRFITRSIAGIILVASTFAQTSFRKDYDWSQDVPAIKAATLLVFGDADAVRTAHAVQFFEFLGGGKKDGGWDGSGLSNARLAILPGLTHYTIFSSPVLASTVTPFLDAPVPGAK